MHNIAVDLLQLKNYLIDASNSLSRQWLLNWKMKRTLTVCNDACDGIHHTIPPISWAITQHRAVYHIWKCQTIHDLSALWSIYSWMALIHLDLFIYNNNTHTTFLPSFPPLPCIWSHAIFADLVRLLIKLCRCNTQTEHSTTIIIL